MKLMTPGPTPVRENVRLARSIVTTNPDLDPDFFEFYAETCEILCKLVNCGGDAYILSGEGILGLEAACASLIEPEDRVLVIDNGVFGKGFADFISIYEGEAVIYHCDYKKEVDVSALKVFLEQDHNFKCATIVHCDTPSGVLNDIHGICNLLKEYGILSIVDAVSSMFGERVDMDRGQIDILCGGSQKVMSAPAGLTMVWVSQLAKETMLNRKVPVKGFYVNLLIFKDYQERQWFPYTMPISDIYGLRAAIDNIVDEPGILERHEMIGHATREAVKKAGLSLYLESGYSNTVTVVEIPEGIKEEDILNKMLDQHQIMLAGSFDVFEGKVLRIGHMGESCREADIKETLDALGHVLEGLGYPLKCSMKTVFQSEINK